MFWKWYFQDGGRQLPASTHFCKRSLKLMNDYWHISIDMTAMFSIIHSFRSFMVWGQCLKTLFLRKPQRRKSHMLKLEEHVGQSTSPIRETNQLERIYRHTLFEIICLQNPVLQSFFQILLQISFEYLNITSASDKDGLVLFSKNKKYGPIISN